MPAELPSGLVLAAFPTREDPRDALLTRRDGGWSALAAGASVGTSSLRRRAMVLARRPDLRAEPIRGNVETRIDKLSAGTYDGIILALAGLNRLGVSPPGKCLNFSGGWTTLGADQKPWRSGRFCAVSAPIATRRWPGTLARLARY
jgi:hydroxymethylbilane synthase